MWFTALSSTFFYFSSFSVLLLQQLIQLGLWFEYEYNVQQENHARHEARVIMLFEIATLAKSSLQLGTESCAIGGHYKVEQTSQGLPLKIFLKTSISSIFNE
jgi:hypothetical protein